MNNQGIGMGAGKDTARNSSGYVPLGLPSVSPLEMYRRLDEFTLEQIANDAGNLNGVEGMLIGNESAGRKAVSIAEFAIKHIGEQTEFLLSSLAQSLKSLSHTYANLKNPKEKAKFQEELVDFLRGSYVNFNKEPVQEGSDYSFKSSKETLDALNLLKLSVKLKDCYTHDHMRSVKNRTIKLADHFGLSGRKKTLLVAAAGEHDIGKVLTPSYLLKTGKYRDQRQKKVMDRHSYDGGIILGRLLHHDIQDISEFLELVSRHHEDYYDLPSGILGVADQYDALRGDRSYRPAHNIERTNEILLENVKSKKLHPEVVDAVVRKGVLN